MSICSACKREMLEASTCDKIPVEVTTAEANDFGEITGTTSDFDPIPFGAETHRALRLQIEYENKEESAEQHEARLDASFKLFRLGKYQPPEEKCHDCGVTTGGYHHPGCDVEECPHCHLQLLSCGCVI